MQDRPEKHQTSYQHRMVKEDGRRRDSVADSSFGNQGWQEEEHA